MRKYIYICYTLITILVVNLLPAIKTKSHTDISVLTAFSSWGDEIWTLHTIIRTICLLSCIIGGILAVIGTFADNWLRPFGALITLLLPAYILIQIAGSLPNCTELYPNGWYYVITAMLTWLSLLSFVQLKK